MLRIKICLIFLAASGALFAQDDSAAPLPPEQNVQAPSEAPKEPEQPSGKKTAAAEPAEEDSEEKLKKILSDMPKSVVTISDKSGGGTGFFIIKDEKYYIVTNAHVMGGIKTPAIETLAGVSLSADRYFIADDRDLVMIPLEALPEGAMALELGGNVSHTAAVEDEMAAFGNSLATGVILPSRGKILGIGPKFVETNCAIFQGNSGSPFYHFKSGKVIAVFTLIQTLRKGNELIDNAVGQETSSIQSKSRYLGYRVDNVEKWIPVTQAQLYKATQDVNSFGDKLQVYAEFYKLNSGNISKITIPGDCSASPEFERYARKLGEDGISVSGRNATASRFQNAKKTFYKDFEFLLMKEKRRLENMKIHPFLENEKTRYLRWYDHFIDIARRDAPK